MFIRTENYGFDHFRITRFCARYKLDPDVVLENIVIGQSGKTTKQLYLLSQIRGILSRSKFALVIVDCASDLFCAHPFRQFLVNKCMQDLQKLAEEFGVAVVVTNFVVRAKKPRTKVMATNRLALAHVATDVVGKTNITCTALQLEEELEKGVATFVINGDGIGDINPVEGE